MKAFEHRVFTLLEADDIDTEIESPEGDKEAFAKTLDKGTNPDEFETAVAAPAGPSPEQVTKKQQLQELQGWIKEITKFISFLNGVDNDSMQKTLNNAQCESLFAEIARSERKRIARLAQDLSGLNESFKGYLLSSDEE